MTTTEFIDFPHADVIDSRDLIEVMESDDRAFDETVMIDLGMISGWSEDWDYGVTLIEDSYFTEYAQQLADDIGAIPSDNAWPMTCIDWAQAARELQMDYTAAEIDGRIYWIR